MELRFLETLKAMGLEEKAATLYLTLLGRSKMTPSQLARESGMKRPTCYEHLDTLLANDYVIREPRGKRMLYSAVPPEKILSAFQKKISSVAKNIEEMSLVHDTAVNRPNIQYYEGKRELKRIYDDLFQTVGDVYSIFPAEQFFEHFSAQEYDEFDKQVSAHAFKSKDLFMADKFYKRIKEIREKNGSENKLDKKLPPWFTCNVDVLIYSNKVALMSLRDLSAIVIENRDIAELFRNMHEFIWKAI